MVHDHPVDFKGPNIPMALFKKQVSGPKKKHIRNRSLIDTSLSRSMLSQARPSPEASRARLPAVVRAVSPRRQMTPSGEAKRARFPGREAAEALKANGRRNAWYQWLL